MTEAALVSYLLDNRYRIPNRAIINCLALARLNPTPLRRVSAKDLMIVFQHSHPAGVSAILQELKRCGLVDFEPGTSGTPGYLIWRVGPVEENAHEADQDRR
jgi:hypothetical protein